MYLKAIKRLGAYECTNYKNDLDLQLCLDAEELILPEELIMPDNPMPYQRIWDLRATVMIKSEEILKQNLWSLYTVVM